MSKNVFSIRRSSDHPSKRRLIPERLVKARKAIRLTQTDLASEIGVTRQSISAYEQGAKSPDGDILILIARALKQPLSFFTGDMPSPLGPFSVKTFRAFGASTRRRNDQCEVFSEWLSSLTSYYSRYIDFPVFSFPQVSPDEPDGRYSNAYIESIADDLRSLWGLGRGPIGNLIKLVEAKGVVVSHLPIEDDRVNAFSFWSGAQPFIFMASDSTTAVRTRFDIAHELGHLVLHQGVSEEELEDKVTLKKIESEANRFAGAFLLPSDTYVNEVYTTRLDSFIPLKSRWKVAISAQVFRCGDLGIFSEDQILNLRKQISARKWRSHEPLDNDIEVERPTMFRKASKMLLDNGLVNEEEILSEININPNVVEKLSNLPPGELSKAGPLKPDLELKLK